MNRRTSAPKSQVQLLARIDAPIEHDPRWEVVSLADVTLKIGSGATPKGGADTYLPNRTNFALVRSQNVFDRHFSAEGLAFISDEQAKELRGAFLQPNDILLNITGDGITFGRACIVPAEILPACVNQHVSIVRVNPSIADPGFILSFLTHPNVKLYIESFNAGGSRRAITKGHIESFRIPLPPLPEQRAIAHVLGTLDDKIELNRRMNETLEAMARAIFQDWFVDFGPVRAKAEGRWKRGTSLPGLPARLFDLFPDRLVDSELGEIPEEWGVKSLNEIAEHCKGAVNPSKEPEQVFEHYSLPAFDSGREPVLDLGQTVKSNKTAIPEGAVLLSKLNPETPRVWIPNGLGKYPQICSTEFLAFKPRKPVGRASLYCLFSSQPFRQTMEGMVTGTSKSHQRVSPQALLGLDVVQAPSNVCQAFEGIVSPMLIRQIENRAESSTLAALRDTLLPKLISGEVRVRAAENTMGEAV